LFKKSGGESKIKIGYFTCLPKNLLKNNQDDCEKILKNDDGGVKSLF